MPEVYLQSNPDRSLLLVLDGEQVDQSISPEQRAALVEQLSEHGVRVESLDDQGVLRRFHYTLFREPRKNPQSQDWKLEIAVDGKAAGYYTVEAEIDRKQANGLRKFYYDKTPAAHRSLGAIRIGFSLLAEALRHVGIEEVSGRIEDTNGASLKARKRAFDLSARQPFEMMTDITKKDDKYVTLRTVLRR